MTVQCTCENRFHASEVKALKENSFSSGLKEIILNTWKSFLAYRKDQRQRKIDPQAFDNVLRLDERALRDMGISRDDVLWASRLPLHENAPEALNGIRSHNIATTGWKSRKYR